MLSPHPFSWIFVANGKIFDCSLQPEGKGALFNNDWLYQGCGSQLPAAGPIFAGKPILVRDRVLTNHYQRKLELSVTGVGLPALHMQVRQI